VTSLHDKHKKERRNPAKNLILAAIGVMVIVVVIGIFMQVVTTDKIKAKGPVPEDCHQLLLVITPRLSTSQGYLYRFTRTDTTHEWQPVDDSIPIILGRSGLGWGRGLHPCQDDMQPRKQEGDGRSPAGVFQLGTVFGFQPASAVGALDMPYQLVTELLECIDDSDSRYYTDLMERDQADTIDWQSSEHIIRSPTAYRLGVVVEHNRHPVKSGAGSCIFIHVWTAPTDSTLGCTTMSLRNMEKLVKWLQADQKPVLVQLTRQMYADYHKAWQLPRF